MIDIYESNIGIKKNEIKTQMKYKHIIITILYQKLIQSNAEIHYQKHKMKESTFVVNCDVRIIRF